MHDHRPPQSARQTAPTEQTYPRNSAMAPSHSGLSPSRQHSEGVFPYFVCNRPFDVLCDLHLERAKSILSVVHKLT